VIGRSGTTPEPLRRSPVSGEALRRANYELRAHDGSFIAIVKREKAEAAIVAGDLELRIGRHGAFLRPVHRADGGERNPTPSTSRTWSGPPGMPEIGRVSQYRHNEATCFEWTGGSRSARYAQHIDGRKK
jgi:hypothetical protein